MHEIAPKMKQNSWEMSEKSSKPSFPSKKWYPTRFGDISLISWPFCLIFWLIESPNWGEFLLPSLIGLEPFETVWNRFNQFRFEFGQSWQKLNHSVWSLAKNGSNQTKPNFPNNSYLIKLTIFNDKNTEGISWWCHISHNDVTLNHLKSVLWW